MLSAKLETALAQVDLRSQAVTTALSSGEVGALEQASTLLRDMAVAFSDMTRGLSSAERRNPQFMLRLKRQANTLAVQRESLIRRMVAVDRGLGILMPAATQTATYGSSTSPYGSVAKQTGAFKLLAA